MRAGRSKAGSHRKSAFSTNILASSSDDDDDTDAPSTKRVKQAEDQTVPSGVSACASEAAQPLLLSDVSATKLRSKPKPQSPPHTPTAIVKHCIPTKSEAPSSAARGVVGAAFLAPTPRESPVVATPAVP